MQSTHTIERLSCPMCKSTQTHELCALRYTDTEVLSFLQTYYKNAVEQSYLQGMQYTINQCTSCDCCYQKEILNNEGMKLLYGKWISPEGSKKKVVNIQRQIELARHIGRILLLFPKPNKAHLLDYGMGWGDWCHMAQSFGFSACGVELDQDRIDFARNRGIKAYLPDDLPEGPYDFIYLEQVLEHLPEPYEVLQKLVGSLNTNGYLHIAVPNASSVAKEARKNPLSLLKKGPAQPLEHINSFSHDSLVTFMKQFDCHPAAQKEMFLRCTSPRLLLRDSLLMCARFLPATIFPHKTSLLFQKRT